MSLLKVAGTTATSGQLYVNDVFSVYLYTGNGSTQTITNGIDLAGKGGLVWTKSRNAAYDHELYDTARGIDKVLISNSTASSANAPNSLTAFNSNGFTLGANNSANSTGITGASWTFRKAAKFFDVVTYTGDGTSSKIINHNLNCMPGMIIVKTTASSADWVVCNRYTDTNYFGRNATYNYALNTTGAAGAGVDPSLRGITTTSFDAAKLSGTNASYEITKGNASGQTYVAYVFAHDTSATGIIQCGGFTFANNGTLGTSVSLGWEPQYVLIKNADVNDQWKIYDTMRGMAVNPSNGAAGIALYANLSAAEVTTESTIFPNATGFTAAAGSLNVGVTYIYMAIRRPNKPPTTGTQVFSPIVSAAAAGTTLTTNFAIDMQMMAYRAGLTENSSIVDRLRGVSSTTTEISKSLRTSSTVAETVSPLLSQLWNNTGFNLPTGISGGSDIFWSFKRAPGFFDVVCYTGDGSATPQAHNLTVVPELMITKSRNNALDWYVSFPNNTSTLKLNNNTALSFTIARSADATTFTPLLILSGYTFVAYLFATLAGISKVGSYTGNGTSQNIECGFAAGARFFLVKATSTTGSWWVWDSARGITSGNDPALQLNSTAAEITTADAVDPYSPGITVNQEATCSINASGVSYIFLAVA